MIQTDDLQLIDAYARDQSEPAFRTLVERYGGLVFNSALRQVRDPHLAEDIAQAVFVLLARKAKGLRRGTIVSGWLFQTTHFIAARVMRGEQRRRWREQKALEMQDNTPQATFHQVAPAIDEALNKLNRADRDAVLLRFFEGKSLREVGTALGSSEEAAKKRVTRALEKLRTIFSGRGVHLSAAVLATALATQAGAAAPTSLTSLSFLTPAAGGSVAGLVGDTMSAWRLIKLKWAAAIICSSAVVLPVLLNNRQSARPVEPIVTANLPATTVVNGFTAPPAAPLPAPNPSKTFKLHAIDAATGDGIPAARVALNTVRGSKWEESSDLTTDAEGYCAFSLAADVARLDVGVLTDGWEARFATWPSEGAQAIPSEYTLPLKRVEQAVGGYVLDPSGRRLTGVDVLFSARGTGDLGHRERPRERFGFVSEVVATRTDLQGRWKIGFLPRQVRGFTFRARHPDFAETTIIGSSDQVLSDAESPELTQLWAGELVTRMNAALALVGVVRNEEGAAIRAAKIQQFEQSDVFTTDGAGQFVIPHLPPGSRAYTFHAEGYAPVRLKVEIASNLKPLEVVLRRGAVLRLRVVDELGVPVSQATVGLEQWGEHRNALEWKEQTDASGQIVWSSAPLQVDLELYAKKKGFAFTRDVHVKADGQEHEIVLLQALTVDGHVVDADSGEEIPDFRAVPAYGRTYYDAGMRWMASDTVRGTNGHFKLIFEDDRPPWQLRVVADGYEQWTSDPLKGPSPSQLEIPLKRSSLEDSVRGIVVRPDGTPANGAQVALLSFEHNVRLQKFRLQGNDRWIVQCDEAGAFRFPVNRLAHSVAAVNQDGFVHQRLQKIGGLINLRLQPWGRVEGMVEASAWTQPLETIELYDPAADNYQGRVSLLGISSVKPDALGRFTFEHIPAGDYCVFINSLRQIPHHHKTPFHVDPGQTSEVTIRELPGVLIKGRFIAPPDVVVDWFKDVVLTRVIAISSRHFSSNWERTEAGMREALAFWTSKEGRDFVNGREQFSLRVFDDGTFVSVERVPPGQYRFEAIFGNASMNRDLTIADSTDGTDQIDLGTLELHSR